MYDESRKRVRSSLLEQIDRNVPNVVTLAQTFEDLLFEGVSWWRITGFGWDGFPVNAEHLDVRAVSTSPPPGYPVQQLPSGQYPNGTIWVAGEPVDAGSIIRFDSPNPPLLEHAARAIRRAAALERTAENYANDPRMLGYFSPAENADPYTDDDVTEFLDDWARSRRARTTGYVPAALRYNPDPLMTPVELQLADLQSKATIAIANAMGLDPEDFGVSTTSRTYQNAVDRRQDRINETYAAYLRAIEDRLSMNDVTPRTKRICFDLDDFMKADPKTRAETYQIHKGMGSMTTEEIREEEDRPPLPASEAAPAQDMQPTTSEQEAAVGTTFSAETVQFETERTITEFRVDTNQRIIAGLAVPYGVTARSGGRKWRFQRGSLKWSDVSRVKLLRDHDHAQALGKAISLDDTPDGLYARFRVARGAEGDKVLALAEDGVLDGLSIGVDFDANGFTEDKENPGAYLVTSAALREITLTAMPAFDAARLDSVTTSTDERDLTMTTDATTGHIAPAAPAAAPDLTAFTAAIETAFTNALNNLSQPQQRETVSAVRATVREPLVYTLDGRGPSFVRDAWEAKQGRFGSKASDDALARLRKYEEQTTDVQFANGGNTTDQAQIIPPGYRPDLYVGQVPQGRPLFDALSKGSISDATSFKVPVWVGSAGLNGTNTEGTGPTGGTITDHTYRTVSPTAQSGEFIVTRELVDSANPAIDQIAITAMREEYAQDTEALIATMLAAATDNDTGSGQSTEGCYVYTVTGDGSDLAQKLRTVEAEFPFHRFAAPDRLVASQTGFTALVGAVDGLGRPLFPFLAPQNAQGQVGQGAQSLLVDGFTCQAAWSMTSTYDDVVLFKASDAWVWESPLLSFRFEEKSGPENIVLNIWGYFATQILRYTSIHAIDYTGA